MSEFPVYMDYGATTPVDEHVVAAMIPWLNKSFGNPASRSHAYGWQANEAIERARSQVAALIGADPREIIWTSGATESDNLAIKGAAYSYKEKGKHLITVKTEHKAVLDTMHSLERDGFDITYLDVQKDGLVDIEAFKAAIRPDTIFTSVMLVNNEIGVIQDLEAIGKIAKKHNVYFHTDCAQAFGKIPLDVDKMNIDLMSISGHKIYGPKGIGALFIRQHGRHKLELSAQMNGGGQERGIRSGTLAVSLIVGLGKASEIMKEDYETDIKHITEMSNMLKSGLMEIPDATLNGYVKSWFNGNPRCNIERQPNTKICW